MLTKNNKKEQLKILEYCYAEKIRILRKYYDEVGLSIIGLNGIVEDNNLFHKGLLKSLAGKLSSDNNKAVIIDCFSTLLNNTEDINYLLNSNPSIEDLKRLKTYSKIVMLEKYLEDKKLPKALAKIGYVSKALNPITKGDKEIQLTDTLKNSLNPIVIYASGIDDLIREVNSNPFKINYDFLNNIQEYNYTLEKINDPTTIKKVIGNIEDNFNEILSYNHNVSLFAVGADSDFDMNFDYMNLFKRVIDKYNIGLKKLCDKYNFDYIDCYDEATYSILDSLYYRKIWNNKEHNCVVSNTGTRINGEGLFNALCALKNDLRMVEKQDNCDPDFVKEEKILVLNRKINAVEKVLMRKI